MMKSNTSKTYTEDDILRMQQEAMTRVKEFQSRAQTVPFYDVPEAALEEVPEECPPEIGAAPQVIEAESRVLPAPMRPAHNQDGIHGLLEKFNIDGDTLLVLGLMLLLYNEKADNVLLLALAYLLL